MYFTVLEDTAKPFISNKTVGLIFIYNLLKKKKDKKAQIKKFMEKIYVIYLILYIITISVAVFFIVNKTIFGFDNKSTNTRQTRMTHRTATSETNIADKQTKR